MYYPKSHITSNLYSNGELVLLGTTTPYVGYYFSTIDKKYYTGRFPNDGNNQELEVPQTNSADSTIFDLVDYRFAGNDNLIFSELNGLNITDTMIFYTPTPYYPQPSTQDYELGEFTRYFSKKANENKYTETSGLFQNSLYIGIKLPWLIAGDKNEVARVNENMVRLREQELGIEGFGFYLKYNYLKFYK